MITKKHARRALRYWSRMHSFSSIAGTNSKGLLCDVMTITIIVQMVLHRDAWWKIKQLGWNSLALSALDMLRILSFSLVIDFATISQASFGFCHRMKTSRSPVSVFSIRVTLRGHPAYELSNCQILGLPSVRQPLLDYTGCKVWTSPGNPSLVPCIASFTLKNPKPPMCKISSNRLFPQKTQVEWGFFPTLPYHLKKTGNRT